MWGNHQMHDVEGDAEMLSCWHRPVGLAALHINHAGGPLSDGKSSVKWSTAAVSLTALPPDRFLWRHLPSGSSVPRPKPSLLSWRMIAVLQPHTNMFSHHQLFSCSKNTPLSIRCCYECSLSMDSWSDSWNTGKTFYYLYTGYKTFTRRNTSPKERIICSLILNVLQHNHIKMFIRKFSHNIRQACISDTRESLLGPHYLKQFDPGRTISVLH